MSFKISIIVLILFGYALNALDGNLLNKIVFSEKLNSFVQTIDIIEDEYAYEAYCDPYDYDCDDTEFISQEIEGRFRARRLINSNENFGLAFRSSVRKMKHISCLIECLNNEDCAFAIFKNQTCGLYNENAKKTLIPYEENILYEKFYQTNPCEKNPCKNLAICVNKGNAYDCLCTIGFFGKDCSLLISEYSCGTNQFYSFKQNKCVACPLDYLSDNMYPFKCFYIYNKYTDYLGSVAECKKHNLTQMRLKSANERQLILTRFGSDNWVDSQITEIGANYFWGDGTKVYGFANNKPDNDNSISQLLKNSLLLTGGSLIDVSESTVATGACDYYDSDEHLYY
ncbi:unnamed protein product [Brachionus calyciflorus]|uniref:EGF-like domain-containing protein n=1 Tax=Brachionus calyciflorus TaxID=104777 RepID=A0A813PC04_9BILA|nr:unnamed protein product [Brachionus calyciflorus]